MNEKSSRDGLGTWILAIAIGMIPWSFAFTAEGKDYGDPVVQIAAVSLVGVIVFASLILGTRARRPRGLIVFFPLIFVSFFSYSSLLNGPYISANLQLLNFIQMLGAAFLMVVVGLIPTVYDPRSVMIRLSIVLLPLVILGIVTDPGFGQVLQGVRLRPFGLTPNWSGEVLFSLFVCSWAARRLYWRLSVGLISVLGLVAVQSRGAMLATAVFALALFRSWLINWRAEARGRARLAGVVVAAGIACIFVLLSVQFGEEFFGFLSDYVFLLADDNRGLGTGLSGRLEVMELASQDLKNRIWFGHGPGAGRDLVIHNGLLVVFYEGGIMMGLATLIFLFVGIKEKLRDRNMFAISGILGYLALTLTSPRFFATAIPCFLFYISIFWDAQAKKIKGA